MLALLERAGYIVERLDITTAAGKGDSAWYELADEPAVPVLALFPAGEKTRCWSGALPEVEEMRGILDEPDAA